MAIRHLSKRESFRPGWLEAGVPRIKYSNTDGADSGLRCLAIAQVHALLMSIQEHKPKSAFVATKSRVRVRYRKQTAASLHRARQGGCVGAGACQPVTPLLRGATGPSSMTFLCTRPPHCADNRNIARPRKCPASSSASASQPSRQQFSVHQLRGRFSDGRRQSSL
jgi:hypothetical protein